MMFFLSFLTGTFRNLLIIYIIVIIHELGHIFLSLKFKLIIKEVLIFPFGGITKVDKLINTNTTRDLILSLGGIIAQLIFLIVLDVLFYSNILSFKTYNLFKYYNFIIILFNLIPIVPLDGYLIFKSFLEKIFYYKRSFYLSIITSSIILLLFIYFNYYYLLNNYLIISFLVYKLIVEIKDFKYVYHRFLLERYFNNLEFKKVKIFNHLNLNKMYKDKYHFFIKNGDVTSETKVLHKLFDKTRIYW